MIIALAILLVIGVAMFIAMGDSIFGKNARSASQLERDTKTLYQEKIQELGIDLKKAVKVKRFNSIEENDSVNNEYYIWREKDKLALLQGLKQHCMAITTYISYHTAELLRVEYIPIKEIKKLHTVGSKCVLDTSVRFYERLIFRDADYHRINQLLSSNDSSGIASSDTGLKTESTEVSTDKKYTDRVRELGLELDKAIKVTKYDRVGDQKNGYVFYMWWTKNKLALFIANDKTNKTVIDRYMGTMYAQYYKPEELKRIHIIGNNCVIDTTKKLYANHEERLIFKKEDMSPIKVLLSSCGIHIAE